MFCDTCIGVLQHRFHLISMTRHKDPEYDGPKYRFGHHTTCDTLVTSASCDCHICQTVWDKLSGSEQESLHAADSRETTLPTAGTSALTFITIAEFAPWVMQNTFRLSIYYNNDLFPHIPKHNTFILEPVEDCTSFQRVHMPTTFTSDTTSSTESMQTAVKWLQECVSSHLTCSSPEGNSTWYPTRLLRLASSCEDESYVRLIYTAQEPPVGPYSTLSHRWGNGMSSQLTQAIASESDPRFLVASLPKTFQEAIQVSKNLGVWYLWIDSLCIIQSGDDRQDWYREASLMDKVYTHSHCNISATDAEDSTKGLFRYRTPQRIGRPRIKINLEGMQPNTEHIECLMTDFLLWPHALQFSPLNKRGWVFQERYLTPRILHFCRNQLFWECREHTVCETFPHELPLKNEQRLAKRGIVEDLYERSWDDFWLTLVWMYTQKELSVPGDKLVALSGVAKYVMPYIKDSYVAGMWRRTLETALMWTKSQPGSRLLEYRAPSWSWASVDGVVYCHSTLESRSLIHVEDVVLEYATEDVTGAVTGGWLDVRGCLKPMRLQRIESDGSTDWHMIVDTSTVSGDCANATHEKIAVSLDILHTKVSTFEDDNAQGRLFFMPGLDTSGFYGLECLLVRLVDPESRTFERIGFAVDSLDPRVREMLLVDLDEETKSRLPCLRYENGLHTIRII